ncbi:unnamed protein product, partial [Ectocarpus fasciculatus]
MVAPDRKNAAEEEGAGLRGPAAAAVRDEARLHAKAESSSGPRLPPSTTDAETSAAIAAEASPVALADASGTTAVPSTAPADLGKRALEGEGSGRESGHGKEQRVPGGGSMEQQQQQQQQRVRVLKPPLSDNPPSMGSRDPAGSATAPPRDDS